MLEGGSRRLALVLGTWERGVERRAPSKQRPFSLSQPFFLSFYLALVTPSRLPPSHPQGWALPAGIYSLR